MGQEDAPTEAGGKQQTSRHAQQLTYRSGLAGRACLARGGRRGLRGRRVLDSWRRLVVRGGGGHGDASGETFSAPRYAGVGHVGSRHRSSAWLPGCGSRSAVRGAGSAESNTAAACPRNACRQQSWCSKRRTRTQTIMPTRRLPTGAAHARRSARQRRLHAPAAARGLSRVAVLALPAHIGPLAEREAQKPETPRHMCVLHPRTSLQGQGWHVLRVGPPLTRRSNGSIGAAMACRACAPQRTATPWLTTMAASYTTCACVRVPWSGPVRVRLRLALRKVVPKGEVGARPTRLLRPAYGQMTIR